MNPPKIHVYCTVREDELEAGPNGLVCTRCIRNLVNLNDPASAGKTGGCGFLRRLGAPALASTLLLSSACQAKPEARPMLLGKIAAPVEAPKAPKKPTEKEPIKPPLPPTPRPVLPGLIAPPLPPPPPPKKEEPKKPEPEKKNSTDDAPHAGAANDWPVAPPHPGWPGHVTSPYTGKPVDVVSFEAGSLICDPAYPMSARKYFRILEAV